MRLCRRSRPNLRQLSAAAPRWWSVGCEEGRGFSQDLPPLAHHPHLTAKPRQLVTLRRRQALPAAAIDIVPIKPATKAALRDPKTNRSRESDAPHSAPGASPQPETPVDAHAASRLL